MKDRKNVQLLREYLREVLTEDGDFGDIGMDNGPGGAHLASGDQLYKIFVKPFADVVKVAAGKTKEMSVKTQTLLNVAYQNIATTLVPVLEDSYEEVFADEKQSLDRIKSEYASVYAETWEAFQKSDFLVAAFMYRPDLFLTGAFIKKSPKVALKLASVLSGGKLDSVITSLLSKGASNEGLIREAGEPNKIMSFFANDKVKKVLSSSNLTRKMSDDGQEVVRATLKKVFSQASGVISANTLDDIQKKIGKKIPGLEKLNNVPAEERKTVEQAIIKGVKSGMKAFYVKQLEQRVKQAKEAGVPEGHPFLSDYTNVISKIKALLGCIEQARVRLYDAVMAKKSSTLTPTAEMQPDELNALKEVVKEFIDRMKNIENEITLLKDDRKELVEEFKDKLDYATLQAALKVVKIEQGVQHKDTYDLFTSVLKDELL